MAVRSRRKLLDSLYVALLILYIVAGMGLVPFHGDESTIIYMSRDWYLLFQKGDVSAVFFRAWPPDSREARDQELRLINGVISKYSYGLAWSLAGLTVRDVNDPWAWGEDWWENLYYKRIPGYPILFVSRIPSTLMIALSAALVFRIGTRLGGRITAYTGALVYATLPALLLNGRRAMFEGAHLLGIALVVLAGLEVAHRIHAQDRFSRGAQFRGWLWLGLASGFALASKHTTIITIAAVVAPLFWLGRRRFRQTIVCSLLAGVTAAALFLFLNPAWWNAPIKAAEATLSLRSEMLDRQTAIYGGYSSISERAAALFQFPLALPQYEEDANYDWRYWIGDQIKAYEASGWFGINWAGLGFLAYLILGAGAMALVLPGLGQPARVVFASVLAMTLITVFLATPLPWQRYYLPLALPWSILAGLGVRLWWQAGRRLARRALRGSHAH